jgi:hypothetical protein
VANLVADTLELQDLDAGYWVTISTGGLDASPTVRGVDTVIPGKSGRIARDRKADTLNIILHALVTGEGSTHAAIRVSYLSRMTALRAIFDPTADPFSLTIHPTAVAVGGKIGDSQTATLNVRFLRFTGPPAIGDEVREFDIECECVDSPPAWVIT